MEHIFESNRRWAAAMQAAEPDFFKKLVDVQNPKYLWIGCSDSRVPANQILGLEPGEIFVHRNVANLVNHTDFNCLSVLQYAIDILKVEHIMVVGHYGCGGVRAAFRKREYGFVDNWLQHVRAIHRRQPERFEGLDQTAKEELLCELNVIDQARHVDETSIAQAARQRGQMVKIHGWVYRLSNGLIQDLNFQPQPQPAYRPSCE